MFRQFLVGLGPKILPILSGMKGFIFSDGKFKLDRAFVLLGVFLILLYAYRYDIPPEYIEFIIEQLDEVSDILGYA